MDELGLFTVALGLSRPWRVSRSEFDPEQAQMDAVHDQPQPQPRSENPRVRGSIPGSHRSLLTRPCAS